MKPMHASGTQSHVRPEYADSVRKDIRTLFRAIRVLGEISPHLILWSIADSTCNAFLPYIPIYMSAKIITELTGGQDFRLLITYVLTTISLTLAVGMLRHALSRMVWVKRSVLRVAHEMYLNEKSHSMDFIRAEDPKIAALKERIIENTQMYTFGLTRVPADISVLFQNLVSIITALALSVSMFRFISGGGEGLLRFVNTPAASVLFALLLIAAMSASFLCRKASMKRFFQSTATMGLVHSFRAYYQDQYLEDNKAAKDIRIFKQKNFVLDEIEKNSTLPLWNIRKKNNRFELTVINVATAISTLMGGMVYAFVGLKAFSGTVTLGNVVQYYGAINRLLQSVIGLSGAMLNIRENTAYLQLFFEYIDTPSEMRQGAKPVPTGENAEWIFEFCDVSFRYPGTDYDAVHKLNLRFKTGEHLAVVGRNGSGKTTMIKLLSRLYDPTQGCITLNGVDIREYDYTQYMALFSVVFQDFRLLAFPVGQNVAANTTYDEKRVWDALELAGAKLRVEEFEQGLKHALYKQFDEEGIDISGGEEQKIAIARALYKDAPFVILDEPTAALDPISEYEIYARFDAIAGGKTAVYISHRLSSCRFCDRIAVFEKGELVQNGKHADLLQEKDGIYAALWNAQAQYYLQHGTVSK